MDVAQDEQGRRDRFFVQYENGNSDKLSSLREDAYDCKPMDREEALRRFEKRAHGILVEIVPIARIRSETKRTVEMPKS